MSGVAGIVDLAGGPVEHARLERLAAWLVRRGPHGTNFWSQGSVGLAHALLRVLPVDRQQPLTLDGAVWIVADARLDARRDLVGALQSHGRSCSLATPDAELLLHAYAVWGVDAVQHLLGDFAFALWDSRQQRLFCARDHFGVRPFYYAFAGDQFLFASHPDPLLAEPGVDGSLYEPAIADFLVLGFNHDPERTAHAGVFRLAPAHLLVVEGGRVETRRYWELPTEPSQPPAGWRDAVEQFLWLFEQAVADRLRGERAAVLMSGGLDSSAVAAMATRVLRQRGRGLLTAHVAAYEELIPYHEHHYARRVAEALELPLQVFRLDDYRLMEHRDCPEFREPEPERVRIFNRRLADTLGHPPAGTVVLTGQGSDGLFSSLRLRHCRELARQGRWGQLASDVSRYLLSPGRWRRLYLRMHWERFRGRISEHRPFPDWLNPGLERRLELRQRYQEKIRQQYTAPPGVVRPEAYWLLQSPIWQTLFEESAPECAGVAIEPAHPFFDLRLVQFVLGLPALPWCSDKELLRRAMQGLLPDEVRLRRKTPVAADYLGAHLERDGRPWLEHFCAEPGLEHFVDVERARQELDRREPWTTVVHLRPFMLNFWMKWDAVFLETHRKEVVRV